MSVKVTTPQEAEQNEKPFPKLMKHKKDDIIVFFIKDECGVRLNDYQQYYSNWTMSNFTDYNEPITLQND